MHKKLFYLSIFIFMLFIATNNAEAKKGFYIGLGAVYNTIDGDFTGTSGLQSGSDIIIIPKIDSGLGLDVRFGYGITDQWAVELNLMNSRHNGSWAGLSGHVYYTSFSINGKYAFLSSSTTQPYILFGFGGNELRIKNGAENTSTGEVTDATLSGPGVNMGFGIDSYISPHVSLNIGALYRYVDYTDAEGVNHSGSIDKSLDGSGFSLLMTMAYHF
ncbi:MAG TPA: OmpW family outer membrane protein [Nitrospirota bacterium]|nr:OmpW family outer membrane protein [Nitrospirota bacterium]